MRCHSERTLSEVEGEVEESVRLLHMVWEEKRISRSQALSK